MDSSILNEINGHISRMNVKANRVTAGRVSRRGFCGQVNIDTFFMGLIDEHILKCVYVKIGNGIDVYKYNDHEIYFKRACICDGACDGRSKCVTKRNVDNCDGHHIIIVSPNPYPEIDESTDYVIDLTYKQMLFTTIDDENSNRINAMRELPDWLFVSFNTYVNFPFADPLDGFFGATFSHVDVDAIKHRWNVNITVPCKFVTSLQKSGQCYGPITESYEKKYLKYKKKYLELKSKSHLK
jgi:hypothetical protein